MAELETTHVFNGTMERVFKGLGMFDLYSKYIPGVSSIKVEKAPAGSKAQCLVRYEINIVKTFHYTLEMFLQAPNKISWSMVDSNLMKQNDGSWTLESGADGTTNSTYRLEIKFKGLVPSMITDQVAKANLPLMFAGFQKLIDENT